ncbi:activating transcription factor 7-interacting protein 1-like [Chenopodium quinoa]|uniref:activating transcription factor 7-interacting protein 1-like n=1 Tax=Chenopodium quinoa TaxID=63459 RepID=UPI000B78B584|nr:activating transcription factor 7-interacting protein 1-like [Chenopodium quinoa]XP_021759248.1 activating transcription factor 7-interacting protein 1-like [Chenopodium quinoa]XP_021759249.1 activating transcription factor 7-interacting protein 1-like [Chenopodium quinoa]
MCTSTKYDAKWCAPSIKTQIMQLREEDEEFKKKSKQCSLNKKNPEKEMPPHCQGSKPTERLRIDLEKDLKRKVTPSEVYRKAHVNKDEKFVDKTSETVWADFENKKAANLESEDKRSEDELLLEALGGWKQGRIYGLGSAATTVFDKSQKDNNAKKARIDHVNQLESHVEQLNSENLQLRKELDAANEKLDATTQKLDVTTEKLDATNQNVKTLQEQFQLIISGRYTLNDLGSSSSQPRQPSYLLHLNYKHWYLT